MKQEIKDNSSSKEFGGWRPIDSAPKDGTFLLVAAHNGEVHKAAWMENQQLGRRGPDDWCIADTYGDEQGGYYTVDFPILWMPLPTVPAELQKANPYK